MVLILDRLKRSLLRQSYPKPERVFWWLEFICNLRCSHCDIGKKTLLAKFRPVLTLEQKFEVINRISSWIGRPYSLSFIAGEPFLHQDIFEVLSFAAEKGARTSLTSNGTLISSPIRARRVVESGLSFIAVSIDSINPIYHDKSRGIPGTWKKATKTVKYLLEARNRLHRDNPLVYINSIIMKDNLDDLVKLTRWAKKMKVDGITFQPIASTDFFSGDGTAGPYWFKNSPLWPKLDDVLRFVGTLKEMKRLGYPIKNSEKDFASFRSYFSDPVAFGKAEACMGELKSMLVTHDGFVKMCPESYESFGHILRSNLDQMWHSQQANRARKHIYECESQCKILANNKEDFYF